VRASFANKSLKRYGALRATLAGVSTHQSGHYANLKRIAREAPGRQQEGAA
jgi:hypothetical protein